MADLSVQPVSTGDYSISGSNGYYAPSQPGIIYAGGQATNLPSKDAFYNYIASNPSLSTQEFTNNPWGVSAQEIDNARQSYGGGLYANNSSSFNPQIFEAQYGANKANLQGQLDTLPAAQQASELGAVNSYQNNLNHLDTQNAQGTRDLGLAQDQVNRSKSQSLQQLRDQVGSMYNSYLRQPGVSDSSAAGMIANALGSSASKNRYNVLQGASDQTQKIGNQQQDLQTSYQQQHDALDQWKAQTLNDINMKFLQSRQSIEQQMAGADATKAQALAQQNQGLVQDALSALSNLQNLYGQQKQQLISQYQNIAAPNADLGSLGQYAVKPIDAGKLQGIQTGFQPGQSQTPDLVAPIFQKKQDQFNMA